MIKKSEKLVCAYIALISEKYDGRFLLKNLLFTSQELISKAYELFNDSAVSMLHLQNATKDQGDTSAQKLFVKGSQDSLNDYYRLGSPTEVTNYDLNRLVSKLMPLCDQCLPGEYRASDIGLEKRAVQFLKELFEYIHTIPAVIQSADTSMSSKEAVWIAAATLAYNEFARTGSANIENYLFTQNSISRLATAFNPQTAMATYSQVTGQMVTQGKNNQNYAYLIPDGDKRRIASNSEDTRIRPEHLNLEFMVNTIDGSRTVEELADFIVGEYTAFIESGTWHKTSIVRKLQKQDNKMNNATMNDNNLGFDETKGTDVKLNTILYGPPGTGKTYHTVIYAVAIIENKELASVAQEEYAAVLQRYNKYKAQGRIEFTTFHQSYGYEEFIEGIRPTIIDEGDETDSGNIQYSVQPGVFKKFCEKAERPAVGQGSIGDLCINENATIWKVSLWSTGDNEVRTECLKNGHIRIGWDQYGKDITDETDFSVDGGRVVLNAFMNKMQIGDIVLSCYSASTIDAIGVVTGEYEWHDEYHELKRLRKVEWIVKNIRENILEMNGGTAMTLASVYRLSNIVISDVYKLIEKHQPAPLVPFNQKENYVFIIDEINRGNISKIFGELITLIEATKRVGLPEGMKAVLPYSQKPFGVPENVYIIGTMNTADRSIATIDTALRRRFFFKEMMPRPDVLADVSVEDLSVSNMLLRMNKRIAVLYDREHTIGHAYFMPLKENPTIEALAEIFINNIIPLLQEYFYEDYEKIRLVLGDNRKRDEEYQFIIARDNDYNDLFGDVDVGLDDGQNYEINYNAFDHIEAYRSI